MRSKIRSNTVYLTDMHKSGGLAPSSGEGLSAPFFGRYPLTSVDKYGIMHLKDIGYSPRIRFPGFITALIVSLLTKTWLIYDLSKRP